ncbi:MAG: tetratricopeptide repeat protein [Rhodospirillales bacterium]|jgi:Flp pilus assembly protein TadD|nr:tetratricopeptide repeat protein [Rhodospirillales bacterium]MDP6804883.1 tetratricopeptide repeat protein [Rhodospirillales bacterium]
MIRSRTPVGRLDPAASSEPAAKTARWARRQAIPFVQRAVAIAAIVFLSVGCANEVAGELGEDAAHVDTGAELKRSIFGNYLAGRHAQVQRDTARAAEFFSNVIESDPGAPEVLRATFFMRAMEGEMEMAFALARRVADLDAADAVAVIALAVNDIRAGRFAAAEGRLADLPREGIASFMVPLLRSWALVGLGRTDDALAALEPLGARGGMQAIQRLHTGLINEVAGRTEAAEASYRLSAEHGEELSLRLIELLGRLYQRTGRDAEAEALFDRYREEQPNSRLLEPALRTFRQNPPAMPVADAAEGAAEALFAVANALRQQTDTDLGLIFGQLALYQRPDFPLAQIMVAGIYEGDDRLEKSNAVYAAIDPASPFSWSARMRIAMNLNRLDKAEEAVALLSQMAREATDDPAPLVNLGDIQRGKEDFAGAVESYDGAMARVERVERRHWSLLYSRGIALERSKQWARAETDFLKALELEPDQPYVLNYLGYSWVDQGANLKRATGMIEKAVELRPRDGFIVDSLGWAYFRLGDYAGAVRELERAVELRPQDPVINDHLGDAYWMVGRRLEAQFQWRRALALEPEPDIAEAIANKLENGLPASVRANAGGDG